MYIHFNDYVRCGIDCVASLSRERYIVYGWLMHYIGAAVDVRVASAEDECIVEYFSKHPRVDVEIPDKSVCTVYGFTLVFNSSGIDHRSLSLSFSSGRFSFDVELSNRSINNDLFLATTNRDWRVTFGLLGECAEYTDKLPILRYQNRPYGVFSDWLPKLPQMGREFNNFDWLGTFSATVSPAGEICVVATLTKKPLQSADIQFVPMVSLRPDEYSPAELRLPAVKKRLTLNQGSRCCIYGQLENEWIERVRTMELVVQVSCDEQTLWFRCEMAFVSLPEFLEKLSHIPDHGQIAMGNAAARMLEDVLTWRESAFLQDVMPAPALSPLENELITGMIVDVEGVDAVRLICATRRELQALFDQIVLVGPSSVQAAQALVMYGLPAIADTDMALAFREAIGASRAVVPIAVSKLGEYVIRDDVDRLLEFKLLPSQIGQLLALHRIAAGTRSLSESVERLIKFQRFGVAAEWEPIQYKWTAPAAPYLVNLHFERVWRAAMFYAR